MQRFFEDNPFFLTQARMGVQIPHLSYATNRWSPDFAFTSILGVTDAKDIEPLELKGPEEDLLNAHKHHLAFTAKLSSAIDQPRLRRISLPPQSTRKDSSAGRLYTTQSKLATPHWRADNKDEYLVAIERSQRDAARDRNHYIRQNHRKSGRADGPKYLHGFRPVANPAWTLKPRGFRLCLYLPSLQRIECDSYNENIT